VKLADARDWIRQIADYRDHYVKMISLTGGEPFYNRPLLKEIVELALEQDLLVSIATNAHWASTPAEAIQVLREYRKINLLAVSSDVYHQKFIPLENVRNAVMAAEEYGIPCGVAVCTDNFSDPGYRRILSQLHQFVHPESVFTALTFPVGRALETIETPNYELTDERPASACPAASTPVIFPNGKVFACIGPIIDIDPPNPLILGDLRNQYLGEILDTAELNPVLHAIRIWGPGRLIAMAEKEGRDDFQGKRYVKDSSCHACYDLMHNRRLSEFFDRLRRDAAFAERVAYGRAYYLKESQMAEALGLAS
jgi:MoaA/NifB/PqqE/SkfB family radical SAM enzyme